VLPEWERGTPVVLCAAGPHPIPVSTSVRAGDDRILFAIGRERETLRRLRDDPHAAVLVLGEGVAFTAKGHARVVAERMETADTIVAVELRVESVQDHLADGRSVMLDGPRWRWATEEMAAADEATFAELERLSRAG
jgi:Pyridoxamine 5'-phosphate oxidase